MLIRSYGSYIELQAPFIDERIPLSYIMNTLSKEFMTVVIAAAHLMIECGLYQRSITLSIGMIKRLHIGMITLD